MKIERGIPVPTGGKRTHGKYRSTLDAMQDGDSVFFEKLGNVQTMCKAARDMGIRVRCRREGAGWRVWRDGFREDDDA